jgi:signal recognition particle subunit SRP54
VEQLRLLAQQAQLPLYAEDDSDPVRVAKNSLPHAIRHGNDIIVLDTAGRLHVDTEMMEQVRRIASAASPHHILLVADAMTGQDAVNSAREFNEQLELTGLVLTKLDGDARGGAALSIKSVTGKPVMFITTSEHLDGLEEFHPDRMASRILGMGDVVGLVEKAQETMDLQQAAALQEKIRKEKLGLDDFLNQLRQLRKMGPLKGLLEKIPGLSKNLPLDEFDESELTHVEAMIFSMTPKERSDPDIIGASHRRRIALGSGTDPAEVAQFLKQFRQMRKAMKHAALGGGMGGLLQGAMFGRVPRVKMRSKRLKPRKSKRRKRR